MATIRAYTTIEQSKKLTEILPIESADMCCFQNQNGSISCYGFPFSQANKVSNPIPCWSLASLLNYLKSKNKFPKIEELSDGCFRLTTYIWDGKDCIQVSIRDSIVDACYELILKLHGLKML